MPHAKKYFSPLHCENLSLYVILIHAYFYDEQFHMAVALRLGAELQQARITAPVLCQKKNSTGLSVDKITKRDTATGAETDISLDATGHTSLKVLKANADSDV